MPDDGAAIGYPVLPDENAPENSISKPTISSDDILKQGRELAISGIPLQLSNLFDALGQLRARATGSTAEIFPSIIGQLSDLRGQYGAASQALSKKLGYGGGGQVERGKGQLLSQATSKYAGLIQKGEESGYSNLLKTLGGLVPTLSGGARAPSTSVNTAPYDFTSTGTGLAGLTYTAKQINDYYKYGSSTTGLENSGTSNANVIT